MPSRISNAVVVVLLGLAGASTNGCGDRKAIGNTPPSGGAGTTASAAGTSGGAGSGDAAGTSAAAGTGASAAAGTTADAGTNGLAGTNGAAGTSGLAGANGAAGAVVLGPLEGDWSKTAATPGCGRPAGQPLEMLVPNMIQTMGNKPAGCADLKCGAWSYTRQYFVRLPAGYDATKAYPIVFEGPGCGGKGNNLYALPPVVTNTMIRVGLSPSAEAAAFHATNPNQGCFDDKDGDASVDWVFYEKLYDKLAGELCFDRNRVFAAGNSSGSRMANELACKYAGDAVRPVRAVLSSTAGLPSDPKYLPTCTSKPMAGIWLHEVNNPTNLFVESKAAFERAMGVSGCSGTTYETAAFDPFTIGTGNTSSCKRVKGCPASVPLVICPLPGFGHAGIDSAAVPGWSAFLALFPSTP